METKIKNQWWLCEDSNGGVGLLSLELLVFIQFKEDDKMFIGLDYFKKKSQINFFKWG